MNRQGFMAAAGLGALAARGRDSSDEQAKRPLHKWKMLTSRPKNFPVHFQSMPLSEG